MRAFCFLLLLLATTATASAQQCSGCQKPVCPPYRYDDSSECNGKQVEARLNGQCLTWYYRGTNVLVPANSTICLKGNSLEQIRQGLLFNQQSGVFRNGVKVVSGIPSGFKYQDNDVLVQGEKETFAVVYKNGSVSFALSKDAAENLIALRDGKTTGELVAKNK